MQRSGILLLCIVFAVRLTLAQSTADTSRVDSLKHRSALVAGVASGLVPGLGKLYLGYPHQATSAFTMTLSLGAVAAELFIKDAPPVMQYTALCIASVFYIGNIWGTVSLAKKRENDYRQQLLYNRQLYEKPKVHDTISQPAFPAQSPYEYALAQFLKSDYNNCYNILCTLPDSVRLHNTNALRLWLLCLNETANWERCQALLVSICDTIPAHKAEVAALPTGFYGKSARKAMRYSTFLPGLGQTYAGYPWKGAAGFLLTIGFAGVTAYMMASGLYITGIVYGLYPFFRFYMGGRNLSYNLANRTNDKAARKLKKQYRDFIFTILP